MQFPPGTPILNMDSPTFAEDLDKELGGGPYEIISPTFHRVDGVIVSAPSLTEHEWNNLYTLPLERVKQLGCQIWEETAEGIHWLFPYQWYEFIPDGLVVRSISGKDEVFRRGVTDDDMRFGALSFGFVTRK